MWYCVHLPESLHVAINLILWCWEGSEETLHRISGLHRRTQRTLKCPTQTGINGRGPTTRSESDGFGRGYEVGLIGTEKKQWLNLLQGRYGKAMEIFMLLLKVL